jgi:hypothetical protein
MIQPVIRVGVAACWSDLETAKSLTEALTADDLTARLICAGAAPADDGACDVVVALWSQAAHTSLWVRRAAAQATEANVLVEAYLPPGPTPSVRNAAAAPIRITSIEAGAKRLQRRIRRCAEGLPQVLSPAEFVGPAVAAAAIAAAVAAPFLWGARQEQAQTALVGPSDTETPERSTTAVAETSLPPPTPGDPPPEPKPSGTGQGGPLIENAP